MESQWGYNGGIIGYITRPGKLWTVCYWKYVDLVRGFTQLHSMVDLSSSFFVNVYQRVWHIIGNPISPYNLYPWLVKSCEILSPPFSTIFDAQIIVLHAAITSNHHFSYFNHHFSMKNHHSCGLNQHFSLKNHHNHHFCGLLQAQKMELAAACAVRRAQRVHRLPHRLDRGRNKSQLEQVKRYW